MGRAEANLKATKDAYAYAEAEYQHFVSKASSKSDTKQVCAVLPTQPICLLTLVLITHIFPRLVMTLLNFAG